MDNNEVIKTIEKELSNHPGLYFEIRESTSNHCPNVEYKWFNYVRFRDFIHKLLEEQENE